MKPSDVKALFARMEDDGEEVVKLDGLDDAIVGSAVTSTPARAGGAFTVTVLAYSLKGILKKLKKDNSKVSKLRSSVLKKMQKYMGSEDA